MGKHISDKNPDGTSLGQTTADLISFYGVTPVVQPSGTGQAAITDSGTGTAANTAAAGIGVQTLAFHVNLASLAANGDVLTEYVPGYKFKVLAVDFHVCKAVTTGSKAVTINLEIETTNLTGGVVALTSANCTPAGVAVAGTAVTAANTGTAAQKLSIEIASVTAFVEGDGWLLVKLQNMDTTDAFASVIQRTNKFRTDLVALGLTAGA
ncbi:MAG: hypothetical protein ACREVW_02240 [Burkholderiales bacterium]